MEWSPRRDPNSPEVQRNSRAIINSPAVDPRFRNNPQTSPRGMKSTITPPGWRNTENSPEVQRNPAAERDSRFQTNSLA